jgi:hypothetical protein
MSALLARAREHVMADRQASIERARELLERHVEWCAKWHPDCTRCACDGCEQARNVLEVAAALADAERQRDEARQAFRDLAPSPDGGYGPDGAPQWKEAYIARMLEAKQANERAVAADAALADTQEALRTIEAEHMSPMSDIARAVLAARPACRPEEDS